MDDHGPRMAENDWVTVGSFPHGADLVFIEHSLEEAGIAYFKRDETTIQILPHLSQALGGVRLQVSPRDRDKATQILKDAGVLIEEDHGQNALLDRFDQHSRWIPLVGKITIGWRLIVCGGVIASALAILLHWYFAPDPVDLLVARDWCVLEMTHNGVEVIPNSTGAFRMIMAGCPERIGFSADGDLRLPGVDTPELIASWRLKDDSIHIRTSTALGSLYNGAYAFRVDEFRLTLHSPKVRISCERDRTLEDLFRGL